MSTVREDPIKMHKDANALMENGKYVEARDLFVKVAELYYKGQNYFGAAEMNYKAGECSFALKEYQKAAELFTKSADISLAKDLNVTALVHLSKHETAKKRWATPKKLRNLKRKLMNSTINSKSLKANHRSLCFLKACLNLLF